MEFILLILLILGFGFALLGVIWALGVVVVRTTRPAKNERWGWTCIEWVILVAILAFIPWFAVSFGSDPAGLS